MEWSKIPTNLINGKTDKEILAIVKYQLLYALYEEEPNKILLSRFLTKKQQLLIQNYIKSIEEIVKNDLKVIQKKRNTNKLQYAKNKEKYKNSDSLKDVCQTEQIREDKIREDKNISLAPEKNLDPYSHPIISKYFGLHKQILNKRCFLNNQHRNKLIELYNDIDKFEETLPVVLKRLKYLNFEGINFTPNSSWLLKDDNYIRVLEGTFGTKEEEEEYYYNAN